MERPAEGVFTFDGGPIVTGVFGYDDVFLREASRAAERAASAAELANSDEEAGATAAAILCAAAACEAALSEYITYEEMWQEEHVVRLNAIRGSDEDIPGKWKALIKVFAPSFRFDSSLQYLDLTCLFPLRNHIAHRSSRLSALGNFPEGMADCIRQRRVPIRQVDHATDWTSVVLVHEVARWAAQCAARWLNEARQHLPKAQDMEEGKILFAKIQELSRQTREDLRKAQEGGSSDSA